MIPVLFVLAVLFIIYSVVMFARKGPLPCFHYLMLNEAERAEIRTDKEYRNAGIVMLMFAAACAALYFFTYDLKPKKWEDLPESKIKRGGANDIL